MTVTQVDLVSGEAAHSLLRDPAFRSDWLTLHDKCPHATAYQAPSYAVTWYEAYRSEWRPVIALARDVGGDLAGLWLLAHNEATNSLTHVGAHQAEYAVWLTLPGMDASFLAAAWLEVKRQIAFSSLRFKYLPALALAETLQSALAAPSGGVAVRKLSRPLLRIDAEDIKASAAKKSNKSRFNRLKKLGKLEFRRVTDPAELERVFDDLILYYDFRHAAINHAAPFLEDKRKRKFHTELFAAGGGAAYVTATLLDDRPIAGFWGTETGNTVHLCMLMYSPFLAEHSPGKLHVMQLSEHMLSEGKEALDLTPGGDAWKERFANAHDEVAEVTIYNSKLAHLQAGAQDSLMQVAKQGAARVNLSPDDVRAKLASIRSATPFGVVRKLRNWTSVQREFRVYRMERAHALNMQPDARVQHNSLADLLCFEPGESWQSRDDFLSAALARLEKGESAYTVKLGSRLAHSGWMTYNQSESQMPEVDQTLKFPLGSVALYDFYSQPDFRGQGLYRATLKHMLHAAFAKQDTMYAYICVLADNLPSRHVIEALGFEYQGSFYWESRFGEVKKWADAVFEQTQTAGA